MEDTKKLFVALSLAGVSASRFKKLKESYGSIEKIFQLSCMELTSSGITQKAAKSIIEWEKLPWQREMEECANGSIDIITVDNERYPPMLKNIYDPPYMLYVKGQLPRDDMNIGIVGTRHPSVYGVKMSEKFSFELSQYGFNIISGLARGIDTSAHRGALRAHGVTVGVMGSGFDNIYPKENNGLCNRIYEEGAVITEFPKETRPDRMNFPKRNRIISGLSRGLLVVEAGQRSGAIITSNLALEQGREVFAIPGRIDNLTAKGSNTLLKEGAIMIDKVEDILEALNLQAEKVIQEETTKELTLNEAGIINSLTEKMHIEQLIAETGIERQHLYSALMSLNIKGLVEELPGKIFAKK